MKYSLIIHDKIPLSQNSRHNIYTPTGQTLFSIYTSLLQNHFNRKYSNFGSHYHDMLYGKVFYIHKRNDSHFYLRDADNMSKPLWDALNTLVYSDDKQIRHREAAKLQVSDNGFLNVNVSTMDSSDYGDLLDFVLNQTNTADTLLYIEIGLFDHKRVKFGL